MYNQNEVGRFFASTPTVNQTFSKAPWLWTTIHPDVLGADVWISNPFFRRELSKSSGVSASVPYCPERRVKPLMIVITAAVQTIDMSQRFVNSSRLRFEVLVVKSTFDS